MDSIKFDYSKICNFVTKEEMIALYPEARQALKSLKEGTGKGSDFLGWLNLPVEITSEQLADIEKTAAELRARTQVMVVIGSEALIWGHGLSSRLWQIVSTTMKIPV